MQEKSIVKNTFFKSILNLCNIILPIIVMPAVTGVLTTTDLGYSTTAETYNTILVAFASFGVYQYGLREISRVRDDKDKLQQTFTTLFIMSSISTLVVYLLYMFYLMNFYTSNPAYETCMIIGLNIVFNLFYVEWINEALENYDFITKKTMIIKIIYSVLILLLIKTPDKYLLYIWLGVAVNVANNLASFTFIKKQIKFDFSNLEFKKHFKPMLVMVIISNTSLLYTQFDRWMLSKYNAEIDIAAYGIAQKAMTIINTLMLTIIQVTMPRLSNNIGNNNRENYNSLLNRVMKIYFLLLFPASMGLFCVSRQVMWIFRRTDWAYVPYASILMVFAIYMMTLGVQGIMSNQIIYLNGKEKYDFKIFAVGGVLNAILNGVLLATKNFNGATAIATTLISNLVVIAFEYVLIKKLIDSNIRIFSMENMKYFFYSLLFVPITFAINKLVGSMIISCVLDVALCGILYLGILIMTKDEVFNEIFQRMFKSIKQRIR